MTYCPRLGTEFFLPPPLWGRVGEGGGRWRLRLSLTPLPALRVDLPLKGGGDKKELRPSCGSFR
jgi:hypothetical protein